MHLNNSSGPAGVLTNYCEINKVSIKWTMILQLFLESLYIYIYIYIYIYSISHSSEMVSIRNGIVRFLINTNSNVCRQKSTYAAELSKMWISPGSKRRINSIVNERNVNFVSLLQYQSLRSITMTNKKSKLLADIPFWRSSCTVWQR